MSQSYFVWNGVDSREMGITLRHAAPIVRPEERVSHVVIPGMAGDYTELEGEGVYNSYIQTVEMSVKTAAQVRLVYLWLQGSGYITFSGQPYYRQQARVIGAVSLEKISRNLDTWAGQVQFYCQPLKESLTDTPETFTSSGTLSNTGAVPAYPIIYAYPSTEPYMDITVNGNTLRLTNIRGIRRIDCKAKVITNATQTVLVTKNSAGPFPVLQVGNNTIAGSGWSKLEIYKNERYL